MKYAIAAVALALAIPALAHGEVADTITLDDKIDSMSQAGVGPVEYPHKAHVKLYDCNDCHPSIFKDKHGANDITMKQNMEGNFCGSPSCHNSQKAFPLFMCTNCHTNVTGAE